jgi:TatD DNase family protein
MYQRFIVILFIILSNNSAIIFKIQYKEIVMLIDTHCHVNLLVKSEFNVPLTEQQVLQSDVIAREAEAAHVAHVINVGTNFIESQNCIRLAQHNPHMSAVVGLHPDDCTADWQRELREINELLKNAQANKIVGIGECGFDFHHKEYNKQRQKDVFKAQIELALNYHLPLIIHTRDAGNSALDCLEEYKNDGLTGVFHCFSESHDFALYATQELGFFIGIGGSITYPKNNELRALVHELTLSTIVLETDAPFLPPQVIRGQKNHPREIATIAQYLSELLDVDYTTVATKTTQNAKVLFGQLRQG